MASRPTFDEAQLRAETIEVFGRRFPAFLAERLSYVDDPRDLPPDHIVERLINLKAKGLLDDPAVTAALSEEVAKLRHEMGLAEDPNRRQDR